MRRPLREEKRWLGNFDAYVGFLQKFGRKPIVKSALKDEKSLGVWIEKQRTANRKGLLQADRRLKLESIAFIFDPYMDEWVNNCLKYKDFVQENGREPSTRNSSPAVTSLGTWCKTQRLDKLNGRITEDRISRLNAVGFIWNPFDQSWENNFLKYVDFIQQHGREPSATRRASPGEKSLKSWVTNQRDYRVQGGLAAPRVKKLQDIGFNFHPNTLKTKWDSFLRSAADLCIRLQDGGQLTPEYQKTIHWLSLQLEDFATLDVVQQAHIQELAETYPDALKQFGLSFSASSAGDSYGQ